MRYVRANFEEEMQMLTYRFYVTDGLKVLCGFNTRYADIALHKEVVENRSSEEIISSIKAKLAEL